MEKFDGQLDPWRERWREVLEREKEDLRRARRWMGRLSRVMEDFSVKNRSSWPGLAERVLGALIGGAGMYEDALAYMGVNDRVLVAEDIPLAMKHFDIDRETNVVFERGEIRAMSHRTPQGVPLWALHYDNSGKLWRGQRALRLDLRKVDAYGPGEVVLSPIDLREHRYVGSLSECIEQWRRSGAPGASTRSYECPSPAPPSSGR